MLPQSTGRSICLYFPDVNRNIAKSVLMQHICRGETWRELNSRTKTSGIQYKRRILLENIGGRESNDQGNGSNKEEVMIKGTVATVILNAKWLNRGISVVQIWAAMWVAAEATW